MEFSLTGPPNLRFSSGPHFNTFGNVGTIFLTHLCTTESPVFSKKEVKNASTYKLKLGSYFRAIFKGEDGLLYTGKCAHPFWISVNFKYAPAKGILVVIFRSDKRS